MLTDIYPLLAKASLLVDLAPITAVGEEFKENRFKIDQV